MAKYYLNPHRLENKDNSDEGLKMARSGQSKTFHHRGTEDTEFYLLIAPAALFNNNLFFSVHSVPLW